MGIKKTPFLDELVQDNVLHVSQSFSQIGYFFRRFQSNFTGILGVIIFSLIILTTVLSHFFQDALFQNLYVVNKFSPLSVYGPTLDNFPFGIFGYGNIPYFGFASIFSEVILGSSATLQIGIFSALCSGIIGIMLGLISGYFGGWIDMIIMRITDLILAIPFLPFVIALTIVSSLSPTVSFYIIIFSLVGWGDIARIMRIRTIIVANQEYIEAAEASGVGHWRIIFRHVLINSIGPVLSAITLSVGTFMLAESTLDFLYLGITTSFTWGNVAASGTEYILAGNWWWTFFPGLFISLTTLSLTLISQAMYSIIDIRSNTNE